MKGGRTTIRHGGRTTGRVRDRLRLTARLRDRFAGPDGADASARPRALARTDPRPGGAAPDGTRRLIRDPATPPDDRWSWAALLLGAGVIGLISLFRTTAWSMVDTWSTSDSFGHGFLIVPICAYLLWHRRSEFARTSPRPNVWGVGFAAAAAFAWLLGDLAGAQVVQQFALVAMIQGMFVAIVGTGVLRIAKFPIFYLYFAVPIGTILISPLQDFTAQFLVRMLRLTGIPVHLDGIFLQIPSGSFEVAEACAGLRFLITSIALGVVFAYVMYHQPWRRLLFIALSITVPIIANGFRAYGIVMLAHDSDYQIAASADHITYGLIFLSMVFLLLLAFGMVLREPSNLADPVLPTMAPRSAEKRPASSLSFLAATAAVLLTATLASGYAGYAAHRVADTSSVALIAPRAAAPWATDPEAGTDWRPVFLEPNAEVFQTYAAGDRRVDLYIAYYTRQHQGAEVVFSRNTFVGASAWERAGGGHLDVTAAGEPLTVAYTRIRSPSRRRVVWHWYWVDGQFTSNPVVAKFLEVKAKLTGGTQAAAAIGVAADYQDRPEEAFRAIKGFLDQSGPIRAALERAAR